MKLRSPDFLGTGVIRCGTSWTFKQLSLHPEICVKGKELHFFDWGKYSLREYRALFSKCPVEKVCGEWTPGYFTIPGVPNRIKSLCPDAKILIALRNPLDRAWSNFKFSKYQGRIPVQTSFNDAFFNDFPRNNFCNTTIKENGIYVKHLRKWFAEFPRQQICVLFFEDLAADPAAYVKKLYRFIGVDDGFVPPNINVRPDTEYHHYCQNFSMNRDVRERVLAFYRPSVRRLEKLLEKDLSHWK